VRSSPVRRERSFTREFAAGREAPSQARTFLWDSVGRDRSPVGGLDVGALLVTELVSNAVRHGSRPGGPIEVTITTLGPYLHVAVSDQGPGFDRNRVARGDPGFGIVLLDQLASRWGVDRSHEGTVAWFEIVGS
jgi:anti-sigma regulatory factor (Ser/Thr protein kinase)